MSLSTLLSTDNLLESQFSIHSDKMELLNALFTNYPIFRKHKINEITPEKIRAIYEQNTQDISIIIEVKPIAQIKVMTEVIRQLKTYAKVYADQEKDIAVDDVRLCILSDGELKENWKYLLQNENIMFINIFDYLDRSEKILDTETLDRYLS